MSSIIAKPFSWANKIVQAVFKGTPNLITTSDLNRQIEALKKEMYVLQQSSSAVISDLDATLNGGTLSVSMTYAFCLGVKFDFDMADGVSFNVAVDSGAKELRLYATRVLVTYDDDFSKEVSGAKFADGTTYPAANHYVYEDPIVELVDATAPNSDFQYAETSDKEYICTLLRVERRSNPDAGYFASGYYLQKFTTPMGKGVVDMGAKYGQFDQFELATKSNVYEGLVPNANDDWKTIAHKLWSRIYSLEKRLFMETNYGAGGPNQTFYVNGVQSATTIRKFIKTYTTNPDFGEVLLEYNYHIVGNICFVAGRINFPKNDAVDPLTQSLSFSIGKEENELPYGMYYMDTACAMTIQNRPDLNTNEVFLNVRGCLDQNKLIFVGIPQEGADLYWYLVYCFDSSKFWQYSKDDRYGFFNDIR